MRGVPERLGAAWTLIVGRGDGWSRKGHHQQAGEQSFQIMHSFHCILLGQGMQQPKSQSARSPIFLFLRRRSAHSVYVSTIIRSSAPRWIKFIPRYRRTGLYYVVSYACYEGARTRGSNPDTVEGRAANKFTCTHSLTPSYEYISRVQMSQCRRGCRTQTITMMTFHRISKYSPQPQSPYYVPHNRCGTQIIALPRLSRTALLLFPPCICARTNVDNGRRACVRQVIGRQPSRGRSMREIMLGPTASRIWGTPAVLTAILCLMHVSATATMWLA